MKQSFIIECREKAQIPGCGWIIEGYVREGIVFPDTDVRMVDAAGRKVMIATILGFIQGEDVVDFVREGQWCGVLMRYVDLTELDLTGCCLREL